MRNKKIRVNRLTVLVVALIYIVGLYFVCRYWGNNKILQIAKIDQEEKLAYTETKTTNDGFEYEIRKYDNDTKYVCITGYKGQQQEVKIPNEIENIASIEVNINVFKNNEMIKKLIVPNSVKSLHLDQVGGLIDIDGDPFEGCINLETIEVLENNSRYSSYDGVLYDKEKKYIYSIPEGKESVKICVDNLDEFNARDMGDLPKLKAIDVITEKNEYKSIDGVLYGKINGHMSVLEGKYALIRYPQGREEKSYNIDECAEIIGISAFENCKNLTNITLPETIKYIQNNAFLNCTELKRLDLPSNIVNIGWNGILLQKDDPQSVFRGCTSLESINIVDANEKYSTLDGILYNKEKTELIKCPEGKIGTVVIPETVTNINNNAFQNCNIDRFEVSEKNETYRGIDGILYTNEKILIVPKNVSGDITIPKGITEIVSSQFTDCVNIKNITIPDSITKIGRGAFKGCSSLGNMVIPNKVTTIENYTFEGCTSLKSITISDSITKIGEGAFKSCSSLGNVVIPNQVTTIESSTFEGCTSLKSVTISDSMLKIGDDVFRNCSGLTSIVIPNQVTTIGSSTFEGCTSLKSITIPDNITKIGWGAFKGCSSLCNMIIPNKVTTIENYTFEGCSSLKSITIPDSMLKIGDDVFRNCSGLTSIVIPNQVTTIGSSTFEGCTSLKSITIPDSITKIGRSMFQGCSSLESIKLPNTITEIGVMAFSHCSNLISLNIPNGVKKIEYGTFEYCTNLKALVIPNSVIEIGGNIVIDCDNLTIYSYSKDSAAVRYAIEHMIPYNVIKEGEQIPVEIINGIKEKKVGNKDVLVGLTIDGNGTKISDIKNNGYFSNKTIKFLNKLGQELSDSDKVGTGTKVEITDSEGKTTQKIILIYGDTNGDGLINAIDALAIVKNKLGDVKFTDEVFLEAGRILSSSGTPSATDALAIVKHKNGTYTINQSK